MSDESGGEKRTEMDFIFRFDILQQQRRINRRNKRN